MAIDYYEREVFGGATFADMNQPGRPQILINASDLGHGVRFTFAQEYFNLLCSDLSSYPVSRAVAASSAVPILFHPVVVENHDECDNSKPEWLRVAEARATTNPDLAMTVSGLGSYLDKDKRKFAHLVDGGITDNLGLRAYYDLSEVAGGVQRALKRMKRSIPRHLVLISVNASTKPSPAMDQSNKNPDVKETITSVTDVQLNRYNVATLQLMRNSVVRWADALSTPERQVSPHFIQLSFRDVPEPKLRLFFNQVPTSFDLSDEQVDKLIKAGRELLRWNPEFQRLLTELGGRQT
jgi:NTE family protein